MKEKFSQEELRRRAADFRKQITRSSLTTAPLDADWRETLRHWQKEKKSQYWSRMAIRCLCAAIEARIFVFKKMAEHMAPLNEVVFAPDEIEILAEEKTVEVNGVKKVRSKFLPLAESVKETFRLFAKAGDIQNPVDFGDVGFQRLCRSFEVRNRLMHPKRPFDLEVRESDIDDADAAIIWFNSAHNFIVEKCNARSKEKSEALSSNQ